MLWCLAHTCPGFAAVQLAALSACAHRHTETCPPDPSMVNGEISALSTVDKTLPTAMLYLGLMGARHSQDSSHILQRYHKQQS